MLKSPSLPLITRASNEWSRKNCSICVLSSYGVVLTERSVARRFISNVVFQVRPLLNRRVSFETHLHAVTLTRDAEPTTTTRWQMFLLFEITVRQKEWKKQQQKWQTRAVKFLWTVQLTLSWRNVTKTMKCICKFRFIVEKMSIERNKTTFGHYFFLDRKSNFQCYKWMNLNLIMK